MADQIPPALLAGLDQDIAAINEALDLLIQGVQVQIAQRGRSQSTAFVAQQYVLMGVAPPMARLFAVAVARLAEAEEQHGG